MTDHALNGNIARVERSALVVQVQMAMWIKHDDTDPDAYAAAHDVPGNNGCLTLLHEIGHGLGLNTPLLTRLWTVSESNTYY